MEGGKGTSCELAACSVGLMSAKLSRRQPADAAAAAGSRTSPVPACLFQLRCCCLLRTQGAPPEQGGEVPFRATGTRPACVRLRGVSAPGQAARVCAPSFGCRRVIFERGTLHSLPRLHHKAQAAGLTFLPSVSQASE